jgi:hypothetical protein
MSSVTTFISALKTGETRTTRALQALAGRRRGAPAEELIVSLRRRGALNAPLGSPFRQAVRKVPLPERFIERCIDAWPDAQKERVRRALVRAIDDGDRVRFRWGLTAGRGYETEITRTGARVTITALSPRSTLRLSRGEIYVAPGRPAKKRGGG